MADVEFKDYTIKVQKAMSGAIEGVLEDVAGELESQVKRNTVVKTGETKSKWTHIVTKEGSRDVAYVGNTTQNSIWEEFGTGEYALNGDGRKGGWFYKDEYGKGHFTHGKHPRRPFWNAYSTLKNRIIKHIQDALKGGLS